MKILKDLFYGPGNLAADLGRILATVAALMMLGGQIWNVWLGLPIELGPTGLGGGLGAVLAGIGALIFAKDKASAEARVVQAVTQNVEEECAPKPKRKAKR